MAWTGLFKERRGMGRARPGLTRYFFPLFAGVRETFFQRVAKEVKPDVAIISIFHAYFSSGAGDGVYWVGGVYIYIYISYITLGRSPFVFDDLIEGKHLFFSKH